MCIRDRCIRAEEEQITAARAKQHEDEEDEDTGIRPKNKTNTQKNVRAEEEQTTAARTKQHEGEEEGTGIRPAGREK